MATMKSPHHPVFLEINLNTHLVAVVTNTDTVRHLKENILLEHLKCFPMRRNIVVNAVKVKRNNCFYHLSDSVPVKSLFERVKGTWFLYVDAVSLEDIDDAENQQALEPEKLLAAHVAGADLAVKHVESSDNEKKKHNPTNMQQVKSIATPSDLKRKASLEAKVISKTRIKKKRCTKLSDAEAGLLNSGAGKVDSANDVVPVTLIVADHSSLEARKAGKGLPPTGKSKKVKIKTVVTSSPCLEKEQNDVFSGENSQLPSGILEHSIEKSYLEGVNGSTNEDPKSSAAEGEGIDFMEHFVPKDHKVV